MAESNTVDFFRFQNWSRCSTMEGVDTFDDVIADVATDAVQLTRHDLVGPTHDWAVSLEKTNHHALTDAFPRSSCVVEVVGRYFLSHCDTCRVRFSSRF
jgi:hypothetical protein